MLRTSLIASCCLVVACSDPAPEVTGTLALWEPGCETSGDCLNDGKCISVLGSTLCAEACVAGDAGFATCEGGACEPAGGADFGCKLSCAAAPCPAGLTCADRGDGVAWCAAPDAPGLSGCDGGQLRCGDTCVSVKDNADHCGKCDNACAEGGTCDGLQCTCPKGQLDCDGLCINVLTNVAHCGNCNADCTYDHASPLCVAGKCQMLACKDGYLNCDGEDDNGCEVAPDAQVSPVVVLTAEGSDTPLQDGDSVPPQTLLMLDGLQSSSPDGAIAAWDWSVSQPPPADQSLSPNSTSGKVTFMANVIGSHGFSLQVTDEAGNASCSATKRQIVVQPDALIHVEMQWAGAGNVDLHLVRAAEDDTEPHWMDPLYSVWEANPDQPWGNENSSKDDGKLVWATEPKGPEMAWVTAPEHGFVYRVGVHARPDVPAPVNVTVRVYVIDHLEYERSALELRPGDLWYVGDTRYTDADFEPELGEGGMPVIYGDFAP